MRNTNRCSGDALKEWIDKKNISYSKFAKMLGIEYVHLWRIMSSRNRPGWATLLMIAKITDEAVTPNDFSHPLLSESGIEREKPLRSAAA